MNNFERSSNKRLERTEYTAFPTKTTRFFNLLKFNEKSYCYSTFTQNSVHNHSFCIVSARLKHIFPRKKPRVYLERGARSRAKRKVQNYYRNAAGIAQACLESGSGWKYCLFFPGLSRLKYIKNLRNRRVGMCCV